MKPNFINLSLCDNDYSQHLEKAARQIADLFKDKDAMLVSEDRIKDIVIDLVVAYDNLWSAYCGFSNEPNRIRNYLRSKLIVTFSPVTPDTDHDGGSVCIDLNLDFVWRY